jgi:hypothetical protein
MVAPHNLPVGLTPGHVPGIFFAKRRTRHTQNLPFPLFISINTAFKRYSNLPSAL